MKKLISCLLAVLLVCSLMSMSVFAADTTSPIVGNKNNGLDGGVGEEDISNPNNPSSYPINVNFGQTTNPDGTTTPKDPSDSSGSDDSIIVHRYAVDITYGDLTLDLTNLDLKSTTTTTDPESGEVTSGEVKYCMVWDVNAHRYVLCTDDGDGTYTEVTEMPKIEGDADGDGTVEDDETIDVIKTPYDLNGTIYITNHSDLSVYTKLTLKDNNHGSGISWKITDTQDSNKFINGNNTITADIQGYTATQTITKATAETTDPTTGAKISGSATNGSEYKFTATPAANMSNGWLDVVGGLMNNTATTIGTITVTIAKDAASLNA